MTWGRRPRDFSIVVCKCAETQRFYHSRSGSSPRDNRPWASGWVIKYPRLSPLAIVLALSLSTHAAAPLEAISSKGWLSTGRLIDQEDLHFGVRPAAFVGEGEVDVGLTIQFSTNLL